MKKNLLVVNIASALLVLGMMFGTSCKKEDSEVKNERVVVAGGPSGPSGSCGDSTISGWIPSNLTLKSCKVYKLDGFVYLINNAVLTIEPGTVIKGMKGLGFDPGGTLIVTRGCKLIADGTAENPIVFTSNEAAPQSGDWSGVVLLGRAPTNHLSEVPVEGIPGFTPFDAYYGGPSSTVANDNSGILRYVRIEYAGYELTPDNELNGLTLAGVGSGTILDYIEVYKAKDDAFEFFGGTVNASHLLAIDPLDDMFDTDNGYTGTITYALGVSDINRADKSQSNGFECDNNLNGDHLTPYTHPTFNYITIVGQPNATAASIINGEPSGTGKYGRGAHMRRNAEFTINNSILMGFNYGISLDRQKPAMGNNTQIKYDNGTSTLNSNYVHAYVYPFSTEINYTAFGAFTPLGTTNRGYTTTDPNFNVKLRAPFATTRAISNYIPQVLSAAKAAGAFPVGNTTWADGWTVL